MHAPFSAVNSISRIGDFEKMAVTPLKKLKTTWLSQSGQFFGWFWGGQFSSLFSFGAVFFQKMGFLDFLNFQNYRLLVFRGPWGDLGRYFSKKIALTINLRPFEEFTDAIT